MLKIAKTTGRIQGFEVSKVAGNSMEITHLQYAHDTLIFCGAEEEQLLILRLILVYFEAIYGIHISWNKSHLYPINVGSGYGTPLTNLGRSDRYSAISTLGHAFGGKVWSHRHLEPNNEKL